ncbi:Asp23/Gls24 family envelope stress response protein [Streptomyces sp. NPDC006798]|uniref:Asp23/Gls24 family envelope stress response protein n=1 Tax=Streptomyces sp. NPDC006798 TaxID=3155462 RepID=UPI0033CBAA35
MTDGPGAPPGTPGVPGPGRVAAGDRGATVIAERVVAKIAARAAREALDRIPEGGSAPHAGVVVHRDTARVRISLDLEYPADIGQRCAAVRRRVVERVKSLAGMDVPEVDIAVEHLHPPRAGRAGERDIR